MTELSLQQRYFPAGICFGCGPTNAQGLQIQSFPDPHDNHRLVAEWVPKLHHQAFEGVLNGGIVGALLDCHCNWMATYALMQASGSPTPPCTVTAHYAITLMRPTPVDRPIFLEAKVSKLEKDRAAIQGSITAKGQVTATCAGLFVAVKPGHPGFHRW